ncbi:RNA polymerase sigma factor [Roseomonas sp. USHLN139]|uniref:RNA polymerase sigma factor n=1 Tax=Roseomonas sp. USHLN139 TaxID=3081298 RepID=UPI003B028863
MGCTLAWDIQALFRRHSQELLRFLRGRGVAPDVAADISQDVFLRLLTAAPQGTVQGDHHGQQPDNPRAYLFQTTRNLLIDHRRRERSKLTTTGAPEALVMAIADPTPSADTQLYDRERLALMEAALAELPDRTRRAFELHRMEQLTVAQVGERLGLSTTRSWTLIRDAYAHLRKRLRHS